MKRHLIFFIAIIILLGFGSVLFILLQKNAANDKVSSSTTNSIKELSKPMNEVNTIKINKKQFRELSHDVLFRTNLSNTGCPVDKYYVESITGTVDIKFLLKTNDVLSDKYTMRINGDGFYYYSVFECEGVGKVFVIYRKIEDTFFAMRVMVYTQNLSFEDFQGVSEQKSTYEDIKKIEPNIDSFFNDLSFPLYEPFQKSTEFYKVSAHMTKEGIVLIGYTLKDDTLYVDCVEKIEDPIIQTIYENEML